MKIPYYHVDAFTSSRFGGKSGRGDAGLNESLPDETPSENCREHNLSETALRSPDRTISS